MKKVKGLFWRIVLALFALLLLYQVWLFAHICWWIKFNPATSSFMEDRLEVMQDKNPKAGLKHKWVPYKKISNNLKRALIAAEGDGLDTLNGGTGIDKWLGSSGSDYFFVSGTTSNLDNLTSI